MSSWHLAVATRSGCRSIRCRTDRLTGTYHTCL
jgi:hypothetical protein